MTDYTPTTEHVKNTYDIARIEYDEAYGGAAEFDRWLGSVKAEERERIVRHLENIATNVIKSGNEYWDGYVRALEDVRLDNWPLEDADELR
jgi:hypothetical protein